MKREWEKILEGGYYTTWPLYQRENAVSMQPQSTENSISDEDIFCQSADSDLYLFVYFVQCTWPPQSHLQSFVQKALYFVGLTALCPSVAKLFVSHSASLTLTHHIWNSRDTHLTVTLIMEACWVSRKAVRDLAISCKCSVDSTWEMKKKLKKWNVA